MSAAGAVPAPEGAGTDRQDERPGARDEHVVFGRELSAAERAAALARHVDADMDPTCGHRGEARDDRRPAGPAAPSRLASGRTPADAPGLPPEEAEAAVRRAASAQRELGAFVSVADPAAGDGSAGRAAAASTALTGVPVAVKDNIAVKGMPLTANSALLEGQVADADAAIVERLRETGAWVLGKAALDEFAFGTVGPGIVNPASPERTVGGSSGGSAAAVAAGACPIALGTDTGGSVRIPASCTGIVGFKPTSGWFSNDGVIPLSWSLDVIGLFARTVEEVAAAHAAIEGRPAHPAQPGSQVGLGSLRVAIPDEAYLRVATGTVAQTFSEACDLIRSSVATVEPVDLPDSDDALNVQYLVVLSEAACYHRHRWGSPSSGYSDGVRTALEQGDAIRADEYLTAQRARRALRRRVQAITERYDVLVLPTLAVDPPLVGSEDVTLGDGRTEKAISAMLRFTSLFNHTGHPAITVPLPTTDGVPRGLQLVGRHGEDASLLHVAGLLERTLTG
ncbi:MAG: amidase [Actinomadura sp.]